MLPFHPTVVHLPIVVSFLLPIFILIFALMIRQQKMSPKGWLIIIGMQIFVTGTGYIALESGEVEEDKVEKVVAKKLISEHEEASEIFVGVTVLALVLGISAFFIRKEFQFYLQMSVLAATLVAAFLACKTGSLGGDLVYQHGAASVYSMPVEAPRSKIIEVPVDDEHEYSHDEDDHKDDVKDED